MLVNIIVSGIGIAAIYLYGCVGEIITEKAGHLNLGIPGIMCFGTLGGCVGASLCMNFYKPGVAPNWFLIVLFCLLFSVMFSAIAGGIYAFLTVSLKCNQNVTGLALTTFGAGIVDFFMGLVKKTKFAYASKALRYTLPFADNLGWFGKIFFGHGIFIYLSIAIAIATHFILKKTRIGLNLRAVGENPATADAAGINVTLYKYAAIEIGSMIAGLGGITYVMDYVGGSWENSGTIQAFGWLAIALVIFTIWRPLWSMAGSLVFGILYILPYKISGLSMAQMQAFKLLPYIVTIGVLILTSIMGKKSVQPPASLGLPYFREER